MARKKTADATKKTRGEDGEEDGADHKSVRLAAAGSAIKAKKKLHSASCQVLPRHRRSSAELPINPMTCA